MRFIQLDAYKNDAHIYHKEFRNTIKPYRDHLPSAMRVHIIDGVKKIEAGEIHEIRITMG